MSKESLLKKEFKHSDVERVRNLHNKDFTSKTKIQVGHSKKYTSYKEGDIWEESGKSWTIKDGIKQNVTKLDNVKKSIRLPLTCPKCSKKMNGRLDTKMYKIHGMCFDPCTVEFETQLRLSGVFEQYQKRMMEGNLRQFSKDLEQLVQEDFLTNTIVTEDGTVEDWKGGSDQKQKALKNVKEIIDKIDTRLGK